MRSPGLLTCAHARGDDLARCDGRHDDGDLIREVVMGERRPQTDGRRADQRAGGHERRDVDATGQPLRAGVQAASQTNQPAWVGEGLQEVRHVIR